MMNDTIANQATAITKWGGVGMGGLGALGFNEYLAIAGFLLALLGTIANFLLNWYYKHQSFKLEKENATKKQS